LSPENSDNASRVNHSLARLLEQADLLLREWNEYGQNLRSMVEAETQNLRSNMQDAMNQASQNIDMEQALGQSIRKLRAELERLSQGASTLPSKTLSRAPLVGIALANILLVALLIIVLRSPKPSDPVPQTPLAAAPTRIDAGIPDASFPPDAGPSPSKRLCSELLENPDKDRTQAFLKQVTEENCGENAARAIENIESQLSATGKKRPKKSKSKKNR
jgi:hypothetical protein